jgi:hypothetical protein
MTSADWVWGGWVIAFGVLEARALASKRQGDTLSERVRAWFRVNTGPGRALFTAVWSGFAVWFLIHILSGSM